MDLFRREVELPVSAERVFAWHEEDGAFERLTPEWENVQVLERNGGIQDGGYVVVRVGVLGPIGFKARYEHSGYDYGKLFVDEQAYGPFRYWRHEHRFHELDGGRSILEDVIEYVAPPFSGWMVRHRLERLFEYRHRVTLEAMVG
ncbi:SRPBCC family protein [Rubritalea tangerina]|uniref:SRPBCC family protein n=1 Tax=Rubritalea tangerina TaxID=430798 RepID=A0ABW4ZCS3_9BACT